MVKGIKGYSEEVLEHSKAAADKYARGLRARGYGARVVVHMRHKGNPVAWTVWKSNRKLKR